MDGPGSQQRMIVALLVLAGAAVGVGLTMEPGRYRALAWVLVGFFAFRVLIGRLRHEHEKRSSGSNPNAEKLMEQSSRSNSESS